MAMPAVPESVVARVARAGSLLAVALGLWYAACAIGLPFAAFAGIALVALTAIVVISRRCVITPATIEHSALPLVPLLVVTAVILVPVLFLLHGATGAEPHWFASSDEAFTILTARGLERGFPPPDLSWAGQPLRYHLGAALLEDLLHRTTRLPIHAVHYAVSPVLLRLILIAAILLLSARIAPTLPPRWRVWMPLAAGAFPTIDLFNVVWHLHDIQVRGAAALHGMAGMPIASAGGGLLPTRVFESSLLALAFATILIATWRESTWIEKAALLFAVFLSKAQVFLGVGAAYGLVALIELARRRWRPCAAGALALAGVLASLRAGSTYGATAKLTVGCGALCRQLLLRHHLDQRFPPGVVLAIEFIVLLAGLHVFALAIAYAARRRWRDAELLLGTCICAAGVLVATLVRMAPSDELRARFLAVHAGVADRLFMPRPVYLDRILDISVAAAFDTMVLLPILAVPLLAAWMLETPRRGLRNSLRACVVILLLVGAIGILRPPRAGKEIRADALLTLRAIPANARAVITNDLAWDDERELHLPLLNIWAPAASGRQFWASAFMFTFQHPDAAERRKRVDWFFSPSTSPHDRLSFARAAGIDYVFLRNGSAWTSEGWRLVARNGQYALYAR